MVLTDDGCTLWTTEAGRGEPLIACHGGPGLWDMFGDLAALVADHVRVIRWDQRGCGRSERRGPYSVVRSVADLDAVRRHFGLDRVALLGHSWGAHLALRYALAHPERVTRLVYVSGVGLGWDWRQEFSRNFDRRLDDDLGRLPGLVGRDRAVLQWSAEFADPDTALQHAERMATPWFEINQECGTTITAELERTSRETELVAACRNLPVPTRIIDGAQDIRPRWAVDSLEQALPSVTRVVLPNAGHVPWLETPEAFGSALLS